MKLTVYSLNKGKTGHLELPPEIDKVSVEPKLLHQAIVIEAANLRQPHAHTKNRAAVRGGGRKPWRQKGTGRARASSIRSPLWPGGAVAFGLTAERNFKKRLSTTARTRAFQMALTTALNKSKVHLVADWTNVMGKTKEFVKQVAPLSSKGQRMLLIADELPEKLVLAARNLPHVVLAIASSVRTTDLLLADNILLDVAGCRILMKRAFNFDLAEPVAKTTASSEPTETTEPV